MANFVLVIRTEPHLSTRSLKREFRNVQHPPKRGDLYRIRMWDNIWARIESVEGPHNKRVLHAHVSFVGLALLHHDYDWTTA